MILSWDIPCNDGGSHVKSYIVEKKEASRRSWQTVITNCVNTCYKVERLQEGLNLVSFYSEFVIAFQRDFFAKITIYSYVNSQGKNMRLGRIRVKPLSNG